MPKLSRFAWFARLAWIACIAAGCGGQPSPPSSTGAPSGAPPGSASGAPAAPAPGSAAAAPADELCDESECGPPMRMPNRKCPDGSIGGPTGRCLRRPDGKCGWEVRPCP